MQASVKIMDIDIDMLSNDIFIEKMNEYLKDDHLDVILFASAEMLDRAVEDEKYRELIDSAELFLPGEEALLSTHHVDILDSLSRLVEAEQDVGIAANVAVEQKALPCLCLVRREIAFAHAVVAHLLQHIGGQLVGIAGELVPGGADDAAVHKAVQHIAGGGQ